MKSKFKKRERLRKKDKQGDKYKNKTCNSKNKQTRKSRQGYNICRNRKKNQVHTFPHEMAEIFKQFEENIKHVFNETLNRCCPVKTKRNRSSGFAM